jgi:hypothetical protein
MNQVDRIADIYGQKVQFFVNPLYNFQSDASNSGWTLKEVGGTSGRMVRFLDWRTSLTSGLGSHRLQECSGHDFSFKLGETSKYSIGSLLSRPYNAAVSEAAKLQNERKHGS